MSDPFEAELEQLVQHMAREMARDITALILRRLGITGGITATVAARPAAGIPKRRGRPSRTTTKSNGAMAPLAGGPQAAKRRRSRASSGERAQQAERVARVVSDASGLSAGEIERASGLVRPDVDAALKSLKEQGRIFMGGTRRWARYAASQAAADRASEAARK